MILSYYMKGNEALMKIYLNKMSGIDDAIVSMFISKRSWTRELEENIYQVCQRVLDARGKLKNETEYPELKEDFSLFNGWVEKLVKWGWMHITMLRFIDMSITVEGLHRAGQDDWDSHAKRFNNRIIRSSTRLSTFSYEMSDYYKGKILPTDQALSALGVTLPEKIEVDGVAYVKAINGYIREGMEEDKDVKRGLYMLSIPSTFIFKIDLTEWGHVYKERNASGHANPEVKQCCEAIADAIEDFIPAFNRELFLKIKN